MSEKDYCLWGWGTCPNASDKGGQHLCNKQIDSHGNHPGPHDCLRCPATTG